MADHTAARPPRPRPLPRPLPCSRVLSCSRVLPGLTWRRWLIDMLLIATGTVSVIFEPFSIAVHSVTGLIFVAIAGPHLWHRRTWIRGTLTRLRRRRRLPAALRWSLSQSALLLMLLAVMTASGLYDWLDARSRIRWHAISGVLLIVVAARHAWTRRQWLLRRVRRRVTD